MDDSRSMREGEIHQVIPAWPVSLVPYVSHVSRRSPWTRPVGDYLAGSQERMWAALGSASHPSNASISGATALIFRDENGISVRLESSRTEQKMT